MGSLLLCIFKCCCIAGACGADVVSEGLDDGAAVVRDAAGRPPRNCGPAENGVQSDSKCSVPTECPTRCEPPFQLALWFFHIHSFCNYNIVYRSFTADMRY